MKSRVFVGMAAILLGTSLGEAQTEASAIRFNRDVRPILADKCFACHGPDEAARKADLRLDLRDAAVAVREGGTRAIAPGAPSASDVIHRISTPDDDDRMPPLDSGKTLSAGELETLETWIAQGAEWESHWSFISPKRPPLADPGPGSGRNPIDQLVRQRLKQEGLEPSPPADRVTLLRRVTLDLTGLPPTLEEIDTFLADQSAEAWNTVMDRLLASPRYGEQMAVTWLDAARYADTHGYFGDKERTMWPWRDWVIKAYNRSLPFDQFTIEQLAGDLLPNATTEQKIATGFNRNHTINNETGIIEEEFRIEYVADRVKTTASIWLGLSLECARCHDHKFDPVTQRDYYRFFAFFNSVPERGLDGSQGNAAPFLKVPPTEEQQARSKEIQKQLSEAEAKFKSLGNELAIGQASWEEEALRSQISPAINGALTAQFCFDSDEGLLENSKDRSVGFSRRFKVLGADESSTKADATKRTDLTGYNRRLYPVESPGLIGQAVELKDGAYIEIGGFQKSFERDIPFSFGVWVIPSGEGTILSKIDDANGLRGFDLQLRKGKAVVQLAHRWNDNALQIATRNPVASRGWRHFCVTWDGSGKAAGLKLYLDGENQPIRVMVDRLTGSIETPEPIRLGRRQASGSLDAKIDEVQFFNRDLTDAEALELFSSQLLKGVAPSPIEKRSGPEAEKLRELYLAHHAPEKFRAASEQVSSLRAQARTEADSLIDVMVMDEMPNPREAHLLLRGQYDQPGDRVDPGVPGVLPPLPDGAPPTRLGLAKWLVTPEHPLTARVAVNRIWQQFFGRGLVATPEDFGVQGEWPSHPDLLDWLAVEFVESGWDTRHLIRQIVGSETYRQTSDATPDQRRRDPENRWLVRGPRFRLTAEQIRDHALAASGLLVNRIGGPSVKPWQPDGLWKAVTYDGELEYEPDIGEGLYRRSLYSYWKRQSPPPNLLAFDAPTRETCVMSRSRTNTPLQALVLMNDPVFIEAARHLAGRAMKHAGNNPEKCLRHAFRAATAREPSADEARELLDLRRRQKAYFESHPGEAAQLLEVGESVPDPSLDAIDLATWTTIANVILSLDETITKR